MFDKNTEKKFKRIRRHRRVRAKISGSQEKPRLNVFRSHKKIYLQLIDDTAGKTICQANSREIKKKLDNLALAKETGKLLAERAKKKGINEIVFDRAGYRYHGKVKMAADGAREGGLKF